MPCACSYMADQDFRARVGKSSHVVMLREPVAMVSKLIGALRESDGGAQWARGGPAADDRGLVKDAESKAHGVDTPPVAGRMRAPRRIVASQRIAVAVMPSNGRAV